ncbi:apolipoprotein N-acyltransferase [Noviherbaspirillum sp. Root189]|uniref:apolipoprotein N-acyltransferase n=1 Tax=Noviherbaspirillum sp. Root189 TaxID=1736487 RepID=UPI00070E3F10|nr:apolipoprotein N-acyltransferase [Noviherbaspirillum sp. Root189]KRB88498.1 acyltransferase [Noviherbaspirillum sp. Root189]
MKPSPSFRPSSYAVTLIALVAGGLNVFAFAPFHLWPLQILTLALVFWMALRESSPARSAWIGWAYSAGTLITGVHWLYISMHRYGGMPAWMAALAVVLLSMALSVYAGIGFGLANWLRRRWSATTGVTALMLLPAMWTLAEWLRGWMLTGFPWVSSGYAHSVGPLGGFAPLVGVYGLALGSALVAGCIALLPWRQGPLVLAAVLLVLGFSLRQVEWTTPHGEPISVRLLQGNVPQEMKFAPEVLQSTLSLYHDMISAQPANLIATPETALPLLSSRLPPDYLASLSTFARDTGSHVIVGLPFSDGPGQYANSVVGLSPFSTTSTTSTVPTYRYDKHHLVPFGEFIPPGFRWFVDMMNIPLGDFGRGQLLQAPFAVRDQWVMPNICYEDLFGEEIAAQLAAGGMSGRPQPTILLNVSNIAWFGDSIALPQHLQISQLRSLESGRPMLRSTNTGVTAVINHKGDVIARLAPFERAVLAANVQGYDGLTPYSRFGNSPVIAATILLIAAAFWRHRGGRKNAPAAAKTR